MHKGLYLIILLPFLRLRLSAIYTKVALIFWLAYYPSRVQVEGGARLVLGPVARWWKVLGTTSLGWSYLGIISKLFAIIFGENVAVLWRNLANSWRKIRCEKYNRPIFAFSSPKFRQFFAQNSQQNRRFLASFSPKNRPVFTQIIIRQNDTIESVVKGNRK